MRLIRVQCRKEEINARLQRNTAATIAPDGSSGCQNAEYRLYESENAHIFWCIAQGAYWAFCSHSVCFATGLGETVRATRGGKEWSSIRLHADGQMLAEAMGIIPWPSLRSGTLAYYEEKMSAGVTACRANLLSDNRMSG